MLVRKNILIHNLLKGAKIKKGRRGNQEKDIETETEVESYSEVVVGEQGEVQDQRKMTSAITVGMKGIGKILKCVAYYYQG